MKHLAGYSLRQFPDPSFLNDSFYTIPSEGSFNPGQDMLFCGQRPEVPFRQIRIFDPDLPPGLGPFVMRVSWRL